MLAITSILPGWRRAGARAVEECNLLILELGTVTSNTLLLEIGVQISRKSGTGKEKKKNQTDCEI